MSTESVWIIDFGGAIVGVYATEQAADAALAVEARLDPDSAEYMAITRHDLQGTR